MLDLNLKRLFELRGIARPFSFMLENGFIRSTAHKFVHGQVWQIKLNQIEKLCLILNCTPNDLFVWRADKNTAVPESHAIKALVKKESTLPPISLLVKDIPIEKLDRIEGLLNQLKNED